MANKQQVVQYNFIIAMDSLFSTNFQAGRSRSRCYSSMNYQQYQDFFGTPPKMPAAPSTKPLEDPLDIPLLDLQEEATDIKEPVITNQIKKVRYKIDTIPQIEGSQENSIAFQSPKKNYEIILQRINSRLQIDGQQIEAITPGQRRKNRPRSNSQNSPLNSNLKIIDFLRQSHNRGRKMVKIQ